MRLGAFQFAVSGDVERNHTIITQAMRRAARAGVSLLLLPECAATGYPPVELADVYALDFEALDRRRQELCALAGSLRLNLALGTVRREGERLYNSLALVTEAGKLAGWYDKRALWGWDRDHFSEGSLPGVFQVGGEKIGLRICFGMCYLYGLPRFARWV